MQIEKSGRQGALAAAGLVGALLASTCCILPLVLVMLGVGGAWMGNLTALAPYQGWFVTVTFICLATGFWLVYRQPATDCDEEQPCAEPNKNRIVKIVLWLATILVITAMLTQYLAARFL